MTELCLSPRKPNLTSLIPAPFACVGPGQEIDRLGFLSLEASSEAEGVAQRVAQRFSLRVNQDLEAALRACAKARWVPGRESGGGTRRRHQSVALNLPAASDRNAISHGSGSSRSGHVPPPHASARAPSPTQALSRLSTVVLVRYDPPGLSADGLADGPRSSVAGIDDALASDDPGTRLKAFMRATRRASTDTCAFTLAIVLACARPLQLSTAAAAITPLFPHPLATPRNELLRAPVSACASAYFFPSQI